MPRERDVLPQLLSLLEQRVGLRLNASATQVLAAFDALNEQLQISPAQLLERLSGDSALLEKLATQLTIPETHFFRIKPQIDALRDLVLPDLERRLAAQRPLRCWSAGCSTGEEAYTLAILAVQGLSARTEVEILGTDLHPQSLEVARRGTYGAWSFRDTPEQVREQFFATASRGTSPAWRIADHLRQQVQFSVLNLLNPDWSPLERFDLILCRNVMIYFSNATAQHLIERFAAQLQPGGWLILGPSDPPPLHDTLERAGFSVRYERGAMLYQKRMAGQVAQSAPVFATLELPPIEGLMFDFGPPISPAPVPPPEVAAAAPLTDFQHQLQLGMGALEADDIPAALTALRRAAYLEPLSALAQFLLAKTLLGSAQPDRARIALRQAKRLLHDRDSQIGEVDADLHSSDADLQRAVTALSVMLGES